MALINFRKETSERSDSNNWVKQLLTEQSGLHFHSIEGCNQNANNVVTHLIERARVDYDSSEKDKKSQIIEKIRTLEGEQRLTRKINFAHSFHIPLSYTLYCDENQNVFLFNIESFEDITFIRQFSSYQEFSDWIKSIKGWVSSKHFRESDDLPNFDKALRKAGTAWPTNIDCFVASQSNQPRAIIEFQNANKTSVQNHCNNDFFLCKFIQHNDIRRWTSQEILRVQSGLKFFIITWSEQEPDFIFKAVDRITIPYFDNLDYQGQANYKSLMSSFVRQNRNASIKKQISDTYSTFNFDYTNGKMQQIVNSPSLSEESKTFPFIYYSFKQFVAADKNQLITLFNTHIN